MNKIATYEEFISESTEDYVLKMSIPGKNPDVIKVKIEDALKDYFDGAVPKDIDVSTKYSSNYQLDKNWKCLLEVTFGREMEQSDVNELKNLIKRTVEQ